jgi:cytochrome c
VVRRWTWPDPREHGFINQERWLERLQPHLIGMHLHDVEPPAKDHLMPPRGRINFARLKRFCHGQRAQGDRARAVGSGGGDCLGLKTLQTIWGDTPTSA